MTLLKLLEGYCELVWKGMNHFGILEVEKEYYTDWHETNMCTVEAMVAVLHEKVKLKCI